MALKIYIKKRQLLDLFGNPVIAVGTSPANITVQSGTIPNNSWVDITDNVSGLEELDITFTERRNEDGAISTTPGVKFIDKAATGNFTVTGFAYKFMWDWVYNSPTSAYNSFSIKIEHVDCGLYTDFVINRSNIQWCENDICMITATAKQEHEVYDCIQKTMVDDDWQGWFREQPLGGKQHPRFSYCNEPKSGFGVVLTWFVYFAIIVGGGLNMIILFASLAPIVLTINLIISVINNLGGNVTPLPIITPSNFYAGVANMLAESAGCGREHPAPLIRDLISNVCDKCGVLYDESTVPLFFSSHLTMSTAGSDGEIITVANPHKNACWFFPKYKKGVRRYKDFWEDFTFQEPDTTTFFQPENYNKIALSDMLDQLKHLYNHEWRIRSVNGKPTLFFLRVDWWNNGSYLYNFQEGNPDRDKIIQGVCFEPDDIKFPASTDGIYESSDASSTAMNLADAYNGKAYGFGQLTDNNPLFKGITPSKSRWFEPTKFSLDGSDSDYFLDTFQLSQNTAWSHISATMGLTNPFAPYTFNAISIAVADFYKKYVRRSIYLSGEYVNKARVIIWDGGSMLNARAMVMKRGTAGPYSQKPMPEPNPKYNPYNDFDTLHPRNTKVRGLGVSIAPNSPHGLYQVRNLLGTLYISEPCELPNYPMYFNAGFKGTLWDWFWFLEDPRFFGRLGLRWYVDIENCCEDLQKLCVFSNINDNIKLGYKVKLPLLYLHDGIIDEIQVKYKDDKETGRTIRLTGRV